MISLIASIAPTLRTLVLLVALGSLAAAAAPVAWHLGGWSAALPEQSAAPAAAAPEPAPVDVGPILDLAPFGAAEVAAVPAAPVGETTLDLVLRGVVLRDDPDASMAFIGHPEGTDAFRPGDDVAGRARLVEVASNRVILDVGGELQTLSFSDPDGAAPAGADASAASGPDRLRALVAAQAQVAGGGGDEPAAPAPPRTTQDYIDLWRDRIRANPGEVLDAIGLIPTENGYRIAEEHDSGVGLAGLRAGDVVTSVNGQAVGDVERDRQLFDDVAASGQARLEVRRDGETIVMSFPLQ